jgi:hypothetical protein
MTEPAPCPLCRHTNPSGNRFCGSCGAPLTSGEQIATRQDDTRSQPGVIGPRTSDLRARRCRWA